LEAENAMYRQSQVRIAAVVEDMLPTEAIRHYLLTQKSKNNALRMCMLWTRLMVESSVQTERVHRATGDVMTPTRTRLLDLNLNALVRIRLTGDMPIAFIFSASAFRFVLCV
jgi:hypothetical protein